MLSLDTKAMGRFSDVVRYDLIITDRMGRYHSYVMALYSIKRGDVENRGAFLPNVIGEYFRVGNGLAQLCTQPLTLCVTLGRGNNIQCYTTDSTDIRP